MTNSKEVHKSLKLNLMTQLQDFKLSFPKILSAPKTKTLILLK